MWSDDRKKYLPDSWSGRCSGCECVYESYRVVSPLGPCTGPSV